MVGNNFKSTIPSELGLIQSLRYIDFQTMFSLTGTVPSELGNLSSLEELNILDTRLSGSVPIEICNLRRDAMNFEVLADCEVVDCECCTCA